jgi:hypothetical protein
LPNGLKYVGNFKNDNFDGYGKLVDKEGDSLFEGLWKDGVF